MKMRFILWGCVVCFLIASANANNFTIFSLLDSGTGGGYYGRGFGSGFGGGHK